ncbi:GntP family permease [Pseudonocardia nematodicida]|uniref:GntP family permease n=1 Tax=Pseudonocardia nematodicida TaxID=1206997 RepID=A0ABV1KIU3_9PSEU
MVTDNPVVAILGFASIIVVLLLLIARYKWHVFIALLLPILLFAFVPTIDTAVFIEAFESGFGSTIQSIAVIIVLGTMIGEALRHSGAVERITRSMMRIVGKSRMPLALTLAGFVVGLAVFSDVGYVILNPLVHVSAIEARASMALMATGLVGSMQLTHAVVPPTPGPIAAAAIVDADLGLLIIYGSLVTLVGSIAGYFYARIIGTRIWSAPSEEFVTAKAGAGRSGGNSGSGGGGADGGDDSSSGDGDGDGDGVSSEHRMPSLGWAYAPIMIPLVLIGASSVGNFVLEEGTALHSGLSFVGWPVFALGIGVLVAYVMAWRTRTVTETKTLKDTWVERSLRDSAMIIMVTGLGGALSQLLRATPAVDVIAERTLAIGIPAIFLPFVLGVLANMITGSTTVGVITAASLTAPMLTTLGLSPEAAMLSGACGSVIIKYVNSSYFWVCMSLSRMNLRNALISFGGVTFVGGIFSMAGVVALWALGVI